MNWGYTITEHATDDGADGWIIMWAYGVLARSEEVTVSDDTNDLDGYQLASVLFRF